MNGPSADGSVIVGEHLHHSEQGSDRLPKRRRAIADRAIDLLAFVKEGEKVIPVALEIIADEVGVVTVGNETGCTLLARNVSSISTFSSPIGPCLRAISARAAISSTNSRCVTLRSVKAYFIPTGKTVEDGCQGKSGSMSHSE